MYGEVVINRGIEQKGYEKSRPPGLGPEDIDKQPLAEHQSKDAARRRQDDEQPTSSAIRRSITGH
jgi:hypothetical protein